MQDNFVLKQCEMIIARYLYSNGWDIKGYDIKGDCISLEINREGHTDSEIDELARMTRVVIIILLTVSTGKPMCPKLKYKIIN